ncbi:hypothetical protein [Microbacterium luticocti]|uniref:hypothetical protein n=1 Tax=Microbacterium luticocti TaxID=451764 RepID=UPI0012EB208E|nr:hypothetical protein [Microbacterium luticocti]
MRPKPVGPSRDEVSVLMQRPAMDVTYDGLTVVSRPLAEDLEDGVGVYLAHPAQRHLSHRLERIIALCVEALGAAA